MEVVMTVIKTLSSLAFFSLLIYFLTIVSYYRTWFTVKDENYISFDFRTFKSLYCRAPDKFQINKFGIVYKSDQRIETEVPVYWGSAIESRKKEYNVAFKNISDYCKYSKWYKREMRNKKDRMINNNTKNAINEIIGERNEQ